MPILRSLFVLHGLNLVGLPAAAKLTNRRLSSGGGPGGISRLGAGEYDGTAAAAEEQDNDPRYFVTTI